MSDRHFVKRQKIREIIGADYEQWCKSHPALYPKGKLGDRFDKVREDPKANPDSLRDDEGMCANDQPSTPHFLMGEAVEHLQGRQKEVYLLTMREGRTLSEVAELLKIEKGTAQKYKERAVKFIEAYCLAAIKKGRV